MPPETRDSSSQTGSSDSSAGGIPPAPPEASGGNASDPGWIGYAALAVLVLLLLLFFATAGIPPNPISELAEDVCFRWTGEIDTFQIAWLGALAVVLIGTPIMAGVIILLAMLAKVFGGGKSNARSSVPTGDAARVAAASQKRPASAKAERPWGWHRRRAAAVMALLGVCGFGVLWLSEPSEPAAEDAVRITLEQSGALRGLGGRTVELHALALGALRSSRWERTSGAGWTTRTVTRFSGVGRAFDGSADGARTRRDLLVPLVPADWRSGDPIEVFCQCDLVLRMSAGAPGNLHADLERGAARPVTLRGVLRRNGLPRFVAGAYRRAGYAVAEPFFLIEPESTPEDRLFARWAVLLIGLLLAAILFGSSFLGGPGRPPAGPTAGDSKGTGPDA